MWRKHWTSLVQTEVSDTLDSLIYSGHFQHPSVFFWLSSTGSQGPADTRTDRSHQQLWTVGGSQSTHRCSGSIYRFIMSIIIQKKENIQFIFMYFDFYFIHLIQNYSNWYTLMFLTWFVTQHVLLTPHCQWTEWKCLGLWWGQPRLVTVLYGLRCADFRGCLLPWNWAKVKRLCQRSWSTLSPAPETHNTKWRRGWRWLTQEAACAPPCAACVLYWDTIKFTVSNNSYQN